MGRATAAGLASSVDDHEVSLEAALVYHLRANFYPPLPVFYVEPLIEALDNVENGYEDETVSFTTPAGRHLVPREATYDDETGEYEIRSDQLVRVFRAEVFLSE